MPYVSRICSKVRKLCFPQSGSSDGRRRHSVAPPEGPIVLRCSVAGLRHLRLGLAHRPVKLAAFYLSPVRPPASAVNPLSWRRVISMRSIRTETPGWPHQGVRSCVTTPVWTPACRIDWTPRHGSMLIDAKPDVKIAKQKIYTFLLVCLFRYYVFSHSENMLSNLCQIVWHCIPATAIINNYIILFNWPFL
jgi:hypothetical protein